VRGVGGGGGGRVLGLWAIEDTLLQEDVDKFGGYLAFVAQFFQFGELVVDDVVGGLLGCRSFRHRMGAQKIDHHFYGSLGLCCV